MSWSQLCAALSSLGLLLFFSLVLQFKPVRRVKFAAVLRCTGDLAKHG